MILTQQKQKPTSLSTYKTPRMMVKRENYLFPENTSDSFLLLPSSRKEKSEKRKKASRTLTVVEFFRKKNREKKSTTTQEKPRSTTKQEKKLQLKDNPGIYFFCTLFFCKKISPSLSKPRTIVWLIVTGGSAAKIDRNCKDFASKKIKMSSSWCEETPSVFVHTANPRVFVRQDRRSKLRCLHLFVDPMTKNLYNQRMYELCMYVCMYDVYMYASFEDSVFVHTKSPRVFVRQDRWCKLRCLPLSIDPVMKHPYNVCIYVCTFSWWQHSYVCMYVCMYPF